ncbi:MAG TPA: glycosyltransferase family 2 protein [Polyangiaceae bacterium]
MWLPFLQRLARQAPGLLGAVWARVPGPVRDALGPFVHPIAVGSRGGGQVLIVPLDAPPRQFDVLLDGAAEGEVATTVASLAARGHRILPIPSHAPLADFARRESIEDAIYVLRSEVTDERAAAARRLGFRLVPEALLGMVDVPGTAFPTLTIIVVTYKNRALCETSLAAVRRNAVWPGLEILVVDNGSSDGSAEMLKNLAREDSRVGVISNTENLGFARAANQGLRQAHGEFAVLLNDDTVVAPGWMSRLVRHLESDPRLGLVCPVTNEIGGDARVSASYTSLSEMEAFAAARGADHIGELRPTETVALFCAAARRATFVSVGFLDERYEVGMFEDDDLSFALRLRGMDLGVAHDAFVHHVGHASFGRLSDAEYLAIWEANRRRFETKWGRRWHPPRAPR